MRLLHAVSSIEKNDLEVSLHHSSTGHQSAIYAICTDGASIYTGDGNGWLVQWDIQAPTDGQLLAKTDDRIFALHHEPNALWAGTMAGHLILLDLQSNTFRKIQAHQKGIFGIYRWRDYLLTIGGDGQLKYWNEQAELLYSLPLSEKSLRSLAIQPEGILGIVGASDAAIYTVNLEKRQLTYSYPTAHDPSVFAVAWTSPTSFASGGRDARLKRWSSEYEAKDNPTSFDAHWYTINAIAVHPTEDLFATGSRDRSIKIWKKSTFALLKVIDATKYGTPNGSVNRLLWLDELLISVGDDRKINWWKITMNSGEAITDDGPLQSPKTTV